MAIKEVEVRVTHDGADKGKVFFIRRMNAWDTDRWGRRAVNALVQSNASITDLDPEQGIAGVAQIGIKLMAYVDPDKGDELLGELLKCVLVRPDPQNHLVERPLDASDIEDASTIAFLREEAFKLHTDFFTGVGRLFSPVGLGIKAALEGASQATQTSRKASASSSRKA